MNERLTTLAAVKDWLGITSDVVTQDAVLLRAIDAASQHILNYCSRVSFLPRDYVENRKGLGKNTLMLRNWPVVSISSLTMAGEGAFSPAVINGNTWSSGYVLTDRRMGPQMLELYGGIFWRGYPVNIVYRAGFEASQVVQVTTSGDPEAVDPVTTTVGGLWGSNIKVVDAAGETMAEIASGVPVTGQYLVSDEGVYTFSLDDKDAEVTITFGYIPSDLYFAVTELVGEWYKRKDYIGYLSKSLGGQETVTFAARDMTNSMRDVLQPYRLVVPI